MIQKCVYYSINIIFFLSLQIKESKGTKREKVVTEKNHKVLYHLSIYFSTLLEKNTYNIFFKSLCVEINIMIDCVYLQNELLYIN